MFNLVGLINIKSQSLLRYFLVHCLSGSLPLCIVNEYPKSGGTWLGKMLEEALNIPFPRNCFPKLQASIMHGHYINSWGMKNVIVMWRDGRDIMVSWYYHCLFRNEISNDRLVNIVRKDLHFEDYNNIYENLPAFIEYSFCYQKHPHFSWVDFVRKWYKKLGVTYLYYENLLKNTPDELKRVVSEITGKTLDETRVEAIAKKFSFEQQSGRKPGQESKTNFMRKGIIGDWRNQFSPEACKVFNHFAGNELVLLGYEKDNSWVG